jgi:succinyl-diaminopimelate desuccinylase
MNSEIDRRIRRDRNRVLELTRSLVQIRSVWDSATQSGEAEVAAFIAEHLKRAGLVVYVDDVQPGRPNVGAIIDSKQPGRTLLFEAHTDVVTEGDRRSWQFDPFGGDVRDGQILGRGASDTKGNLAAAIVAVESLLEDRERFTGRIVLCFPCDEEGLMIGIKHFIRERLPMGIDAAIVCEPEANQVCIAQKGAIRALLRTFGRMAHGAMPLQGANPIPPMARMLLALETLQAEEQERTGQDPYLGWPSITPTLVQSPVLGEAQINVIPDQCVVGLDIRTLPEQRHADLVDRIRALLASRAAAPGVHATLEVLEDRPSTRTDPTLPIVKAVCESVSAATGQDPVFNGVPGATDGTFLHLAGVPIVTIGAGDRDLPHQANEFVEIDELAATVQIYRGAALRFLAEHVND